MVDFVYLVPLLPLLGFLTLIFAGRRFGEPAAGWLATFAIGGSFVSALITWLALLNLDGEERVVTKTVFNWVPVGDFSVDVAFLVDPLSVAMILFVTGVGSLIHLYSIAYMSGDENYSKFFAYLNLFSFAMLMLVLGDNLLVTFLGWEGVGVCSYLLISFWFTDESNATAGKKAFVTNRVGDWGFMVAMFLAFATIGSIDYLDIAAAAPELSQNVATGLVLLLFIGAIGKSAQFPLYLWLPDAMAGPTPVSALIHAATMVTSGVYLLTRLNAVLYESAGWATNLIAWVGIGTAFFAATIAVAQNDIKKVLAYSTISQLGYMVMAVGVGAYVPAIFHMITHAFFKALLFLGAGSVIHGMDDDQDMRHYGGLRAFMPITAGTFIIAWLAIAGVPPFAGFWSKDEILLNAFNVGGANGWGLWIVGLVTALLTAFYMSRQVFMTFFGRYRYADVEPAVEAHTGLSEATEPEPAEVEAATRRAEHHPHESPWQMTTPLVVLAGLSLFGGLLNLPFAKNLHFLQNWLEPTIANEAEIATGALGKWLLALIAVAVGAAGIALAARTYLQNRGNPAIFEKPILADAWRYDTAVSAFMGGPGKRLFEAVGWFDRTIIDGAVNGAGTTAQGVGSIVRKAQTGFVRSYALGISVGSVALLVWFLIRTTA